MASKQESVWILRVQCGDRDAFELVLRRVQPSLRAYLVGLVGPSDADDVLQEVLLQIYRKLTWLENPALFRPGAFRIACRAGRHHAEKRQRWWNCVREDVALEEIASADASYDRAQMQELLMAHQITLSSSAVLILGGQGKTGH
jgi:RNA polymerase sigma-70 factor, ECF subfamily